MNRSGEGVTGHLGGSKLEVIELSEILHGGDEVNLVVDILHKFQDQATAIVAKPTQGNAVHGIFRILSKISVIVVHEAFGEREQVMGNRSTRAGFAHRRHGLIILYSHIT